MPFNSENPFKKNTNKRFDKFNNTKEKPTKNTNKIYEKNNKNKLESLKTENTEKANPMTNTFKQKGVSAFSKARNKETNNYVPKEQYMEKEPSVNKFKSFNKTPKNEKPEIKTFVKKEDDFPTLDKKTPTQTTNTKNNSSKSKSVWNLPNKVKDVPCNEQRETENVRENIKPGWVSIDVKTRKIIRNKDDQAYMNYLNRVKNKDPDDDPEEPFLLNEHQREQEEFKQFIKEMKYRRLCHRLTEHYERCRQEDEERGYPQDVDIVQSWELDEYLERLEWEEKWAQMEEDELYGTSDDEEETEASDLEYW
jgi:hypothetical protein